MARRKKKGEFCNCILVSNLFTHGPQNMKLSMDDVNVQFKNLMSWLNEAWCTCGTHVTTVLSSSVKLHYFFSFFRILLVLHSSCHYCYCGKYNDPNRTSPGNITWFDVSLPWHGNIISWNYNNATKIKKKKCIYKKRNF